MAEKKNKSANIDVLGNIYNNILKGLSLGKTLIMLQGGGRCFAAGTRVRMYDGSLKNIEDIVVGDKVMNADGQSFSNVIETHNGIGQLYRIHPNKSECDYLVNGEHILTIKQTEAFSKKVCGKYVRIPFDKDRVIDISVNDFIAKSEKWKGKYSLFKNTLIDLPQKDLKIDPYYLGYWLGNGSSSRPYSISTAEKEIVEWFSNFAHALKVPVYKISEYKYDYAMEICEKGTHNLRKKGAIRDFCDMFRYYKLINNKHIPSDYIYGSYDDRLKLLAGLIDSDGYDTRRNTIGITQKSKQISESIVELCRLSGFYTNGIKSKIAKCKRKDGSVYKCKVYVVEINHNDFNDLNKYIKVPRKRIHKNCDRDYYVTHFTITKDEIGRYYGFTLDKSPYFMDYQGFVFHNSGKTYNTMIFLVLQCLNSIKKVSIVRQSLPVIKRSVLEDFKTIMRQMGQWDDRRFNKTDCIYYFQNGSVMEFFSAEDEQKLRGPSRDILYANEANEISYYAFSNLRMRTYGYCIVDYNPSFTEEHWLFPLMTDERTYFFKSTFKDNIFLPQAARDEIMSYKETNPALWKIYGEGEFAIIDGLVFPKENWDIIPDEEFPTWLGEEYLGLDWGFTCFSGDTLITTIVGDKAIKDIKAGDFVLTRNGYRRVVAALNKGVQDVTEKEICINGQIVRFVATDNHKFYANGKWKKYEALTKGDNLCVLSSLMGECIRGIQAGSTRTTISANGSEMESIIAGDYTEIYGNLSMGQSLSEKIYTTRMGILLIMTLVTCNWFRVVSMQKYISLLKNTINFIQSTEKKSNIRKKIGTLVERLHSNGCKKIQRTVNGVGMSLLRQMYTKGFVANTAIISGNITPMTTLQKRLAKFAAKHLHGINILTSNVAPKLVHINLHTLSDIKTVCHKRECVYDLSIEDCHEYFANGVLVHNCDPTVCVGAIVNDTDIYVREYFRETGLKTKDIAQRLEPYRDMYKYCDIDNRLVSELEDAGIPLLTMTRKNGESIMTGIRLMNQRHIHITASSTDTIKEFRNYVYKKDRHETYQTNLRPIDKFNHCFTGDTLIKTSAGDVRIDNINVGDFVFTSNGLQKVMKVFRNGMQEVWDILLTTDSGIGIRLSVTPTHKIKTKQGWKQIQNVAKGDVIYLFNNSILASTAKQGVAAEHVLKDIQIIKKHNAETFNLMIDTTHEYFANGLLVSNCIDALRYIVYAECSGCTNDDTRGFSKEELGIFM